MQPWSRAKPSSTPATLVRERSYLSHRKTAPQCLKPGGLRHLRRRRSASLVRSDFRRFRRSLEPHFPWAVIGLLARG
jgi:hypothetical protein